MIVPSMTPRIAIPVPTSRDLAYNGRAQPTYTAAITSSGGEAVWIELGLPAGEALALARTCDGVCLPGSPADVDPQLYGEVRDPATEAVRITAPPSEITGATCFTRK